MDVDERLDIAQRALLEGDHDAARRILDVVLASEPMNERALRIRRSLDASGIPESVPIEAYGDLRPDARHLEAPPLSPGLAPGVRPAPPFGVALLAALNVIIGGVGAFLGFAVLIAGSGLGVALIALGLFQLAAGVGLWRVRPWAWFLSIVVLALGIVLNTIDAMGGQTWSAFLALFQGLVLVYLISVSRAFFPATRSSERGAAG